MDELKTKVARVIDPEAFEDFETLLAWAKSRSPRFWPLESCEAVARETHKTRSHRRTEALTKADAILNLIGGDGWKPIETAPKDGTVIDLWIAGDDTLRLDAAHRRLLGQWEKPSALVCPTALSETWLIGPRSPIPEPYVATHWRPLPSPPHE